MKRLVSQFFSQYGMAGVLAALCLYYSWATFTPQQPRGADAARAVAQELNALVQKGASVLVVARAADDDAAYVKALETAVIQHGFILSGKVQGEPRDARLALEKLAGAGQKIDVIATTADCAAWTVFTDLKAKFPPLGEPKIIYARSYRWPAFLRTENLMNIANQITVVAILAAGMTVVIITGGIDLSVGSLIALSAVLMTLMVRDWFGGMQATAAGLVLASLAGVGLSGLIGAFSGVMVAGFKIPPFIATLAVMQVANGLAYILARGGSIYELPESFTWLGRGTGILSVPNAVWLMLLIFAATHILMSRTKLGRYLYAVGGNLEAARLSGVRVGSVLVFAYTLCGALAGLGGVVLASQLKSGAPTYGLSYELYVIAAVVVGGASLSGGEGKIFGTLIGALIIAVIQNGMNLTGVESYSQKVVLGLVILGAVLLDTLKRRGWKNLFSRHG